MADINKKRKGVEFAQKLLSNGQRGSEYHSGSADMQAAIKKAQQAISTLPSSLTTPSAAQRKQEALDAYLNREDFNYDFNADALYQHYKDAYIRQGRQAMQDTMGQAAALTGGYGSSYAQNVGQQAYNAQLQNLNDVIPELYQMAYDRYQNEGQDLLNRYSLLSAEEQQEYDRQYQEQRDAVSDSQWERSFDYQKEQDAVSNNQWQQSFDYQKEQDAVSNNQWQQSFDYQKEQDAVSNNQWQQGFDYQKEQDAAATAEKAKISEDTAMAMAANGDYSGLAEYLDIPVDYAEYYYLSQFGDAEDETAGAADPIDKPTFAYVDEDTGNYHYYYGGKAVEHAKGVNPVTGDINPDVEHGTFGITGYQPDNISGTKLTEAGWTDIINGHEQNVWKLPDGSLWMWDDLKNSYVTYTENSPKYEAIETENMKKFRNAIPDKSAFEYNGKFSESAYKNQVATTIDVWLSKGLIDDQEASNLMLEYGLHID